MSDVHPIHAPLPGIPIRQRDSFAAWLRKQGMVRYDSHQVARDPGRRWWIMRGSDGWVRAVPAAGFGSSKPPHIRWKVGRAGIRILETYVIRFTKLPVDA